MIQLIPEIRHRNGTIDIYLEARENEKLVHSDRFKLESAVSRRRVAREIARKANQKPEEVEAMILGILDNLPPEPPAPASAQKLPDEPRQVQADEVFLPGAHVADDGRYFEVGNDRFAASAIAHLPAGTIYRRGKLPGEVVGPVGEKTFNEYTVDGFRSIVDANIRLVRWATKGKGDNAEQALVYQPCTRDASAIVLSRAGFNQEIPELRIITPYPIITRDWRVAKPGFENSVYYDQPADLDGLEPETDSEVIPAEFLRGASDFDPARRHRRQHTLLPCSQ